MKYKYRTGLVKTLEKWGFAICFKTNNSAIMGVIVYCKKRNIKLTIKNYKIFKIIKIER